MAHARLHSGIPLEDSISQYYSGTFNSTHFTAVDNTIHITDFGKDNYMGQFFYGIPGSEPQVSIAWASNWQYTQFIPTGLLEGYRSAMSAPRLNYLSNATRIGYILVSEPYNLPLLTASEPLESNEDLGNGIVLVDFIFLPSKTIYFEFNIISIPRQNITGIANFTFLFSVITESLSGSYYLSGPRDYVFWLDRRLSSRLFDTDPFFTGKFSTNILPYNIDSADEVGEFRVSGILDRSIFEVFLQGGKQSATISLFPEQPLDVMVVRTDGLNEGVGVNVTVCWFEGTWEE